MKKRKITAFITAIALFVTMFTAFGVMSFAEETEFTYEIAADRVIITGSKNDPVDLVIPETIEGLPVTEIGYKAFEECKTIKSVYIPANVKFVGSAAFKNCSALESITVADPVTTELLYNAFYGTAFYNSQPDNSLVYLNDILLTYKGDPIVNGEVVIREGTKYIAADALAYLTGKEDTCFTVNVPEGVVSIGGSAFSWSTIKELSLPASLENCDATLILMSYYLTNITVSPDNKYLSGDSYGALYNKDKTELYMFPRKTDEEVVYIMPDTVETVSRYALDAHIMNGGKFKVLKLSENLKDYEAVLQGLTPFNIEELDVLVGSPAEEYAKANGINYVTYAPKYSASVNEETGILTASQKMTAAMISDKTGLELAFSDQDGKEPAEKDYIGTGMTATTAGKMYTVLVPGDINGDGKATVADARLALRHAARLIKLEGVYYTAADSNNDGSIQIADARKLMRISVGLE